MRAFIPVALASALAGGCAAPQDVTFTSFPTAPRYSERHYNWCATTKPAYRRSDNSFQRGRYKRYRCVSPYIRDPV